MENNEFSKMENKISDIVFYYAFCLDAAQGHMNGTPNETRTHLWRLANPAC